MRIFLIGFMGSGKTHVGRGLAALLNTPFIDLDDYLEEKEERSISDIFRTDGADHFRKLEKKYLYDMEQYPHAVIATGGGAPCFFDNIAWMKSKGLTIYLDTPLSILVERLKNETTHRPLLKNKTIAELNDFIEKKLLERHPYYRQADAIYQVHTAKQEVAIDLFKNLGQLIGH